MLEPPTSQMLKSKSGRSTVSTLNPIVGIVEIILPSFKLYRSVVLPEPSQPRNTTLISSFLIFGASTASLSNPSSFTIMDYSGNWEANQLSPSIILSLLCAEHFCINHGLLLSLNNPRESTIKFKSKDSGLTSALLARIRMGRLDNTGSAINLSISSLASAYLSG